MFEKRLTIVLPLALACAVGTAFAQQQTERRQPGQPGERQPGQAGQRQPGERGERGQVERGQGERGPAGVGAQMLRAHIAQLLIDGNKCEVELGQLAAEKAQNEQVKQFAQQMVEQHQQYAQQLQQFAGPGAGAVAARPGTPGAEGQAPTQRRERGAPGTERQEVETSAPFHHPLLGYLQQAGQREKEMVKQELNSKQGADFDKCYIGQQIGAHMCMLAKLEAAKQQQGGSSEFQEAIDKGIQTTQQHLDHAKQIAMQLEGKQGQGTQGTQRRQSN